MTKKPELPSLNIVLYAFGQRLCTVFTLITFCFAVPESASSTEIVNTLSSGLERLAKNFPWLAGHVICEGACESNTGTYKIVALEPIPKFVVKDLKSHDKISSMDELRNSGFPMSKLDQSLLAPRGTISGTPSDSVCEVFQLQATFIKGGVLLTFLGQYQAMDGVGLDQVIGLFSKACRGEPFSEEEIRIGNLAPENRIKLFGDDWKPGKELRCNIVKDDGVQQFKNEEPGVWSLFHCTKGHLREVKSDTYALLPDIAEYISTDDALTALVWQSITRARRGRLNLSQEMQLGRAKDLRQYLDIPQTHPGFVQSMTYHKFAVKELTWGPAGLIAADLRAAINPEELAYYGRSFATFINQTPDKSITSYGAGFGPEDIQISSWAGQRSYQYDFGLGLGQPEAVRLPHFPFPPGLVYFMPKAPDGSIDVAISLSKEDTETLKKDQIFSSYARCVD